MKYVSIFLTLILILVTSCSMPNIETKKIKFNLPKDNKFKKIIYKASRKKTSNIKCFNYSSGEERIMRGFFITKDTLSYYNTLEADYELLEDQINVYQDMPILLNKPNYDNLLISYAVIFLGGMVLSSFTTFIILR